MNTAVVCTQVKQGVFQTLSLDFPTLCKTEDEVEVTRWNLKAGDTWRLKRCQGSTVHLRMRPGHGITMKGPFLARTKKGRQFRPKEIAVQSRRKGEPSGLTIAGYEVITTKPVAPFKEWVMEGLLLALRRLSKSAS